MARWRRARRPLVPLLGALVVGVTLLSAIPATAGDLPTLRIFASRSEMTVERDRHDNVSLDPGLWATPVGGDLELRVSRVDYDSPVTLTQVDSLTGQVVRTLPPDKLDGWYGLKDLAFIQVLDADGREVYGSSLSWCPNSWYQQRLSDGSVLTPHYPSWCGGGPFTKGMVWGIDDGWASALVGGYYYGLSWKADRRHYTIRATLDPAWIDLLEIDPADAVAEVQVTAVDKGATQAQTPPPAVPSQQPNATAVPDTTTPPAESLPDLVALPAWNLYLDERKRHEYLSFNATEWNAGPGTFEIEGFRGPDEPAMDAFQYFLADGEPVGRTQIGQLEFHAGGGHDHWHFLEFTEYSLLDAEKNLIVLSEKQSWCLANTDAIDLSLPEANWQGWNGGLFTSCGGPGALWIREVLDVGWGDTYSQYVSGQAFDITDLPNGRYFVRVQVNPTGSILETSTDNDVEDRSIRIKGKPGHRRVVVPPWHGIDTEGYCYYCG